jgi:hypothetical protein
MANTARLNNIDHAQLTVAHGYSAAFGDAVNQALVFPTEYAWVQKEYLILIQKNEDNHFQSVALLGLDLDENLFLDGEKWNARYVPAMHQRGPFMIGLQTMDVDGQVQQEPVIHVDLDHPRLGAAKGTPIFLPQGGSSPYLTHVMNVLQIIHEGAAMMEQMFAAFNALGLLEQQDIEISLSETEKYVLEDYYVISPSRFAALEGDVLYRLNQAGYLTAAIAIMGSLSNAQHLIALKNRQLDG